MNTPLRSVERRPGGLSPSLPAFALMLALLGGCQPERLVMLTVDKGEGVVGSITALEARTDLNHFSESVHQAIVSTDGADSKFPTNLGLRLHAHSRTIRVQVFAYGPENDVVVAAGAADITLNDERIQYIAPWLILYSCPGAATQGASLCAMNADAGSDGDADTDANIDANVDTPKDAGPGDRPDVAETNADAPVDIEVDTGSDIGAPDHGAPDLMVGDERDAEIPDVPTDKGEDTADGSDGGGPDGHQSRIRIDAGPTPGGCTTYCTTAFATCPMLYADEAQCEDICTLTNLAPTDGTLGRYLSCRLDEASMVQRDAGYAPTGCPLASFIGAGCDPPTGCDTFCNLGRAICGSTLFDGDCEFYCSDLSVGQIGAERTGDTLACRLYWLQEATRTPGSCEWTVPAPESGPCQAQ